MWRGEFYLTKLKCAAIQVMPSAASSDHLSSTKIRSSYVICNSEGVVLRRSAAILKANAEIIAQVSEIVVNARHNEYLSIPGSVVLLNVV